jgi:hypothetical protein
VRLISVARFFLGTARGIKGGGRGLGKRKGFYSMFLPTTSICAILIVVRRIPRKLSGIWVGD